MNTKVSVVIPVYNGEDFIARAIQSVLNQTVRPFEIIVVNDGSKDRTEEQLKLFGNQITVISIKNGGVSNARNMGITASKGDLIAFLDADDIWYENKLKQQLTILEQFPEVGFTCSNYKIFNKQLKRDVSHFSIFENECDILYDQPLITSALEVLVKQNFVGTCSNVLVKREVLEKVGLFNTTYKQAEDYDLWLRCALVTKFLLQSEAMLEKKTHDANLTNNFLETLLFHEKVLINFYSNAQAKPQIENIKDKYLNALALVRYEVGNLFYEYKQPASSFKYFFLGMITSLTIKNFILFNKFFFRKLIRTVSFGLLRNKKG